MYAVDGNADCALQRVHTWSTHSGCDLLAMADIANLEFHEVTASQFAVNAEVEQRKLSDAALHLKANS